VEHSDKITAVLAELEELLAEEHKALLVLDHDTIAAAGERKLALDRKLREETQGNTPRAEHLELLIRVKRAALKNQMLIVHARASVQSVLSMVAGDVNTYAGGTPSKPAPASPLRLSVRG
jgi:hypothetical protein